MSRREFSRETKREALARSGKKCEATGPWYGKEDGERCCADLAYGVEFDHIDMDANSRDNSLSNCAAICIRCHRWKTANHDIPINAKVKRVRDKFDGIRTTTKRPMPGSRASGLKRKINGEVVKR